MTSVVTGVGLGIQRSSASLLGATGGLGAAALGQAGDDVYVNAATGNLVVQATDQVLLGLGVDDAVTRTYNSLGQLSSSNGALWTDAASRQVLLSSLTGTVDAAGSTIQRKAADGSIVTYTYDTSQGLYVGQEGGGALDTLSFSASTSHWTWTDGETQATETYDAGQGGRIISSSDPTGLNTETFGYTAAGLLSSVTTANGESTSFTYNAAGEIASVQTALQGGVNSTLVYYNYDSLGRLTSTTIDLTPGDNSTADGDVYTTTYGYDGSSDRLTSITQSDGSSLQISYNANGQVATLQQSTSSSGFTTERFSYSDGATTETDSEGDVTTFGYDAAGQLTSLGSPLSQTALYAYNANGQVTSAAAANGSTTTYTYDARGNRLSAVDAAGDTTVSTYSASNQLLSTTQFLAPQTAGAPAGQPLTTQYVYSSDGENRLLYQVDPTGAVTQYLYQGAPGEVTSTIRYPAGGAAPPLAGDQAVGLASSGPTTFQLPLIGGPATSVSITSGPSQGAVTVSGSVATYTPSGAGGTPDSFTYTATNADGTSASGTITLSSSPSSSPDYVLAQLNAWTTASWDKSGAERTDASYDARGATQSITTYASLQSDGTGAQVADQAHYVYAPDGQLLSEQDSGFNTSVLNSYDGLGRLISSTNASGVATSLSYTDGASGSTATATNLTTGQVSTQTFGAGGQPLQSTDSTYAGAATRYAYDSLGRLRMETDATGVSSYFVYDADGRKVADVTAAGEVTTYSYNADDQIVETTSYATPLSADQLALLSASGTPAPVALSQVLPQASPGDLDAFSIYDSVGRLAETISSSGQATVFTYDGASRLTSKTTYATSIPASTLASFQASPPSSVVLPAADPGQDLLTTYAYDADGRLIQEIDDAGGANLTTTTTYDAFGDVVATTDPTGALTRYVYNAAGQQVFTIDANGAVRGKIYNGQGALASTTLYATPLTSSQLAALPLGGSPSAIQADLVTSSADQVTQYVYDGDGRLSQTLVPANGATLVTGDTYDTAGDLVAVTDADGQTTRYGYDADGQRILTVDPTGDVSQSTYDAAGRVLSTTSFATPLSAAALALLSPSAMASMSQAQVTSTITANIVPSASDRTVHSVYDADGRLAVSIDAEGYATGYSYDGLGRIVETTHYAQPIEPSAFDLATITGLLSAQTGAPSNQVTRSAYDATGELAYSVDATGAVTGYSYDASGRLLTQTLYATTYPASAPSSLASLQAWTAANASPADRISRSAYDALGREVYSVGPDGAVTATTYEADGRVASKTAYAALLTASQSASLGADPTPSDIAAVISAGSSDRTTHAIYDAVGRLAYTIDADGDVTGYSYDAAGELVASRVYATPLTAAQLSGLTLNVAGVAAAVTSSGADHIAEEVYDNAGRLAYSLDGLGDVTEYDYDGDGQVLQTIAYATPISLADTSYDSVRNAVGWQAGQAGNRVSRTVYDPAGRVAYTIDADGDVTGYAYDAFGDAGSKTQFATTYTAGGTPSLAAMQSWASTNASSLDRLTLNVFNAAGQALFTVDPNGGVIGYTYDDAGRITSERAYATPLTPAAIAALPGAPTAGDIEALVTSTAADELTRFAYDGNGRLAYQIDALGDITHLIYDTAGDLVAKSVSGGALGTYPVADLPTVLTAAAVAALFTPNLQNETTRFVYDQEGRQVFRIDAAGGVVGTSYNAFGDILSTDAYATVLTSDQLASLSAGSTPADIEGLLATSSADEQTTNSYDADGRLLTTTDATGAVTTTAYDAFGNAVSITDPRGGTGYFYYDALNRAVLQVDPDGYVTATSYSLGGQVVQIARYQTALDGAVTTSTLPVLPAGDVDITKIGRDGLDRVVSNTDANNYTQSYSLDSFGDRLKITNQLGGVTTDTYDGRGLLTSETVAEEVDQASGSVTNASVSVEAETVANLYQYDAFGNRTTQVEAAGLSEQRTTRYGYDALNRLTDQASDAVTATSVSLTNGAVTSTSVMPTTTTTYDGYGNITSTTDANGDKTFYYYDDLNRKVGEVDPTGVYSTWSYDAFNNAVSSRVYGDPVSPPSGPGAPPIPSNPANFRETSYSYDGDNRKTGSSISGVLVGSYSNGGYQAQTTSVTTQTVYDKSGDVAETIDGDGDKTWFYYDAAGRKIAEVGPDNDLTTYQLDTEGNVLTEIQYATGASLAITGATTLAQVLASVAPSAQDRLTTFTYDGDGQRLSATRENVLEATVNDLGQVSTAVANSTIAYAYNGLGEVTSETQATGDYTHNSYDAEGRLTAVTTTPYVSASGPTVQPTTLYYYDGLGDVTMTAVGTAGSSLSSDHRTINTYGAGGRLATTTDASGFTQTFGYDANGDVVEKSYQRLQSDGTSVEEAVLTAYDADGRQVATTVADQQSGSWVLGDVQQESYDTYGEVVSKGVNGGAQETYGYDAAGALVSTTADGGVLTDFVDDADGNKTLEIDSARQSLAGETLSAALASVVGADGVPLAASGVTATFTTYDGRGDQLATIQPDRQVGGAGGLATLTDQKAYDAFGDVVQDTDAAGAVTTYQYTALGDQSEQVDPEVASTSATGVTTDVTPTTQSFYDLSGRQVASEDANGNVTTQTLLAGTGYAGTTAKVVEQFDADGGSTTNAFDVWGNIATTTNALGDTTAYTYDALNRVASETTGIATPVHLYGTSGADVLRGGSYEQGNGGADTFIYDQGYGQVEINEDDGWSTSNAVLQLGAGITASDIAVTDDSSGDLIISDGVGGDQMKLDRELYLGGGSGLAEYGVSEVQFADGSSLSRQQLIDLATTGSIGNDGNLYGASGADTFDSHGYSDYEQGDGGADSFVYDQGYGQLEINEDDGWSTSDAVLQFGAGVTASSITVTGDSSGDLVISDGVAGDQIKLDRELSLGNGSGLAEYGVAEVQFADGSSLSRQQLINLATTGSAGNAGSLYGTSGADTFDSQGYVQYEQGNGGADTFVYNQGYGQLEINDSAGWAQNSSAVLQLGAGITATSLGVSNDGSGDLIITDGRSGDQIKLDNEFGTDGAGSNEYGVGEVEFADGSTLSRQQLIALTTIGSAVNSGRLSGTTSAETFDSHGYSQVEQGNGGADTFVYDQGYGQLEINENNGWAGASTAVLQFGAAISASSITVSSDSTGDILIADGAAGDLIKIDSEASNTGDGVAVIEFADGSSLTRSQLSALATTGSAANGGQLYGSGSADTFDSHGYAQLEQGDGGGNSFVYNQGYGQLEIDNNTGWNSNGSVLQLGSGITAASLAAINDGSGDLLLSDGVAGDQIKLDDALYGGQYGINEVEFADGSTLSEQQLISLANAAPAPTQLSGTSGVDTFVYAEGDGRYEINEDAGGGQTSAAVLQLGAGITAADITVSNDGSRDLIVTDGATGDQIKLDREADYGWSGTAEYGVGEVQFSDGTTLSRAQLLALSTTGSQANDGRLYGTSAADTIDSQGYAHYAQGNDGSDTFVYNQGYGALEINEDGGWQTNSDAVLQFGAGITAASLSVTSDASQNLIISDGVAGDQIKIDGELKANGVAAEYGVSGVIFADGTSLTSQQLIALAVTGSEANDGPLYGSGFADTIDSRGEAHYEQGNGGADTFIYDQGYGQLEINEDGGWVSPTSGILQLGAGVTASSITLSNDGSGNLLIGDGVAGDEVKIDGELTDRFGTTEFGVTQIEFSDGSSLTRQQIIDELTVGSRANDGVLYGTSGADIIDSAGYVHDVQGGGGADTFVYGQGYGQLEINENGGWVNASTAVLQLGAGISESSIAVRNDSSGDLIITDGVVGDEIKIDSELSYTFGTPQYGVSSIRFSDGTVLDHQQIVDFALSGSASNDGPLYGTDTSDVIDSHGYAKFEQGNQGSDTFIYNQGYGQLEINDYGGWIAPSTAELQLGSGLTEGALSFSNDGNGDLIITDGVAGDRIEVDGEFNTLFGTPANGIAEIVFADGDVLTRQEIVNIVSPPQGLTTYYSYNGLGERLSESNSEFGASDAETTDYDSQGRITSQVDSDGNVTSYTYSYDGSLATDGLGTFGGWVETQTNSSGLTSTTDQDYFGRTTGETDFGGDQYADTFDAAGRLVGQTETTAGGVLATSTANSYYNTGELATSSTAFGWATNGIVSTQSTYSYDVEGNRLTETYSETTGGNDPTTTSLEDATSTYDALNRTVSYTDSGYDADYPITINYQYDANSNIRHMVTTSVNLTGSGGGTTTQDYWYLYDAANRFTTTEGTLVDGQIVRGLTGTDITYNLAGERASETRSIDHTTAVSGGYTEWVGDQTETFAYTPGGYLSTVSVSSQTYDQDAGGVVNGQTYLQALDIRDALGRVVNYIEYTDDGAIYYSQQSTYDNDGELTSQTSNSAQSDGSTLVQTTSYDYREQGADGGYDGAYEGGQVTHSHQSAYTISGGSESDQTTSDTVNTYGWNTGAYQTGISYTNSAISGGAQTSDFTYDAAGNLASVAIHDGTPSTIVYTTNAQGQILRRVETSSNATNPETYYYFFGGQQVGEVTNDGSEQLQDYAQAIAVRSAKAQEGPFADGGTSGTAYAAFGDAFQQITPTSQGSSTATGSTYTVQAGDTLASVASKLWGDSSLWYLIADANGLSGSATLSAGQVLSIPAQVTNIHNSASTFHVYNPSQAVGDVQPLNPPPAQNSDGGCGIFGEILSIIVAVVLVGPVGAAISAIVGFKAPFIPGAALAEGIEVAVGAKSSYSSQDVEEVAGEAEHTFKQVVVTAVTVAIDVATAAVLAPFGPLAVAAGAALDSVIDQGIDIATGLQKKFSWTEVAVSAVGAGVTDGLGGYAPGASFATRAVAGAAAYVADSATEAALGQGSFGHDLEAGLPGLAASTAGSAALGPIDDAIGATGQAATSPLAEIGSALSGAAGAIAGAATQSALTGANFGRTLEDQLPEAVASSIGSTIGNAIAGNVEQASQPTPTDVANAAFMKAYNAGDLSDGSPAMQFNGDGTSTPILDANGNPVLIDENVPGSGIEPTDGADEGMHDPLIGSVHIYNFKPGASLVPVLRGQNQTFTTAAINAESGNGPALVVNGEQYGLTTGTYSPLDYLGLPQSPSDTVTHGEVIQNGSLIAGQSSPSTFYISESIGAGGAPAFQFGMGNPPANSAVAFGGGIPLIINGLNYGATNLYSGDVNGPLTGSPGADASYLTQKSNLGFAAYNNYPDGGVPTGKVVVAYISSSNQLAVVVQPDGASSGMSLSSIRNYLAGAGYNNAIAFDGSSSATLVVNRNVIIAPANYKNATIDVGIGVKTAGH